MSTPEIRRFKFNDDLLRYKWTPTDFANMQSWIFQTLECLADGGFGRNIIYGLSVSPLSGLTVRVSPGVCINSSGKILINRADADLTLASPAGDPSKSFIQIKELLTETESIPKPLNPSTNVNLHVIQDIEFEVVNGTPAPSPVYSAEDSDGVVVMGFNLTASHSTIVRSDYDTGKRNMFRRSRFGVKKVTAAYTPVEGDDIVEGDGTSAPFSVTLPFSRDFLGKKLTIMKVDSSSNAVTVAPQSGENISGLSSLALNSQWQKVHLYSNGIDSWRVI